MSGIVVHSSLSLAVTRECLPDAMNRDEVFVRSGQGLLRQALSWFRHDELHGSPHCNLKLVGKGHGDM